MKFQIDELLNKRLEYGFVARTADPWLIDVSNSHEDVFIIVKDTGFEIRPRWDREAIMKIRSKYYIKAMFDLGSPYNLRAFVDRNNRVGVKCTLFWLTNRKPSTVMIGNISDIRSLGRHTAEDIFIDYYSAIEEYINTGKVQKDTEAYEFNEIPFKNIDWDFLYPRMHSKQAYKIYALLNKTKTEKLGNLVNIMRPRLLNREKRALTITPRAFEYPLPYNKLEKSFVNNIVLKKGDIIISLGGKVYLINEELSEDIYPPINSTVLRPVKIQPEYLYMYLTSETAQILMESVSRGTIVGHIPRAAFEAMPVILPTHSEENYRELMFEQNYTISDIKQLKSVYQEITTEEKTVEDIINVEWANKIKTYKRQIMQEFLQQDLRELNSCFNARAYKATLILAGSVLEAVLIDWLSEIDKKNYFEERMRVNRNGRWKDADLIDYIDEIEVLKRPSWAKGAERAHIIRKKRNLVHANVVINSQEEINESSCREVINYLKYVIETRGIKLH